MYQPDKLYSKPTDNSVHIKYNIIGRHFSDELKVLHNFCRLSAILVVSIVYNYKQKPHRKELDCSALTIALKQRHTFGLSHLWGIALMGCHINGVSHSLASQSWCTALIGYRTYGVPHLWGIALMGYRTYGVSHLWGITLMGYHTYGV